MTLLKRYFSLTLGVIACILAIVAFIIENNTLWIVFFILLTIYTLIEIDVSKAIRDMKYLLAPIIVLIGTIWGVSFIHPTLKEWSIYGSYVINGLLVCLLPSITILTMKRLNWWIPKEVMND